MAFWSTISDWYKQQSAPQLVSWIEADRINPRITATPLKANQTYIRVTLAEMVLGLSRSWFQDQQPMVSGFTRLAFGDQSAELPAVAAPDKARYAPGASVLRNYRLLGLVPFRGGEIEVEAALSAVAGRDLAANAIQALANVSTLVAPPFAAALQVASKIKASAAMLAEGSSVHLAYHDTLTAEAGPQQFRDGYLAVVRTDGQQLPGYLVVEQGALRVWDGHSSSAAPVVGFDYLLFRFEVLPNRDDLRGFSDLAKLRDAAITAAVKKDPDADRTFTEAILAIIRSNDLIDADKNALATELKADVDAYKNLGHGSNEVPPRTWDEMLDAMPPGSDHTPPTLAAFR